MIENREALDRAATALSEAPVLAIDTEFARFNTYYPMVGLIQIYDGHDCYLIDPLAVDSLEPLVPLMTSPDSVKVFHSGSEDMEVFQHCLGVVPVNLFDSQIAAAALGVGFSMSYQAIVEHYLDITIAKDETRSDWLQRPLTTSQLDYAALDVIYLLAVFERQRADLTERDRMALVMEESGKLGSDLPILIAPEDAYLKAKGLPGLDRLQLGVMRGLFAWRERIARRENLPRNRVIDQKAIFAIARGSVRDRAALFRVEGLTPRQARRYGDEILAEVDAARDLPESELPHRVNREKTPIDNAALKRLRAVVERRAQSLSMAPELLTKRRDLEALLRSRTADGEFSLPDSLTGWREAVVGNDLLAALKG